MRKLKNKVIRGVLIWLVFVCGSYILSWFLVSVFAQEVRSEFEFWFRQKSLLEKCFSSVLAGSLLYFFFQLGRLFFCALLKEILPDEIVEEKVMNGNRQQVVAPAEMKFWMPEDRPDYLSLRRTNTKNGRQETKDQFLLDQAELLRMLVAEANDREIEYANRRIQDNLPEQGWVHLPNGLLNNPQTPLALIWTYPAEPGTTLANWRDGILAALESPDASPEELEEEVSGLSLESFLCRLL